MRMKSLPIIVLLLALTAGNANAQNVMEQPQTPRDGAWLIQNFEDNDMQGWTLQNDPGNTGGGIISNTTNNTTGGQYSYRLSGSQKARYLISPELTNTENGVNVNFWYTNYYGNTVSALQVGYSMTTDDLSEFIFDVPLDIVSNKWREYENELPANVKYIAIAKPNGSSYLFVDDIVFSDAECPPAAVSVTTKTSESISLAWSGNSESYDLRYAPFYVYDFNDAETGLGEWSVLPATNSWEWNPDTDYSHSAAGSTISDVNVSQHDNYLVSPLINFGGSMTFYVRGIEIEGSEWKQQRATPQYDFKVMYTNEENPTVNDFIQVGEVETVGESWQKYTIALGYPGNGHVAICHIYNAKQRDQEPNQYKLAVDDITVYSPWEEPIQGTTSTNYTIGNLVPETYYAIQVNANDCDKWSATCEVQTLPDTWSGTYEFVHAGAWNMESNWSYGMMPPVGADVTISAAATIPSDYVASVEGITMSSNGSITIAEGGQLKHSNSGVKKVIMEKNITGYTTSYNDHYQLLAFPVASNASITYNNFRNLAHTDSNAACDFYYFDQNEELEWINYSVTPTPDDLNPAPAFSNIEKGKGYLYARNQNGKIIFNFNTELNLQPSNDDVEVQLAYTAGQGFAGWNLIGNPYACNAYFTDNRPFYRMVETAEGSEIVLASPENGGNVIAPMEGIFVQATGTNQEAVFTSTEPQNNRDGLMDFTLRKANTRTNARIDRTRIMFGEGSNMSHLDLMSDPNRLYFPIDDKAMAVVYSQPVGELPLNLEVATDGTFVLGFECRIEDLAYCHLIDNLTGTDIDLLQQPEYTFEGRKTDYASRFRVVFATGSSVDGDSFAFINSMGNLSIFGIEGNATVQVIDMLGRVLSSEQFSGSYEKKLNVAPGVYVLRLIQGNDVKVQKMIVR